MTMATPCSSSSSTDKSSFSAKNATPEPWKSPELSSKILPQDLKIEAEGVEDSNNIQHFNGTKKRNRIDTDTDPVHDCMVDSESSKPESKPAEPANKKKKGNDNVEDAVSDENAERGAGQEQMSADARHQEISLHFSHFLNSIGVRHNRARIAGNDS